MLYLNCHEWHEFVSWFATFSPVIIYLFKAVKCILMSVGFSSRSREQGSKTAPELYHNVENDEKRILK